MVRIENQNQACSSNKYFQASATCLLRGEGNAWCPLPQTLPCRFELSQRDSKRLERTMEGALITCHRRRAFWLPSRLSGWWGEGENKSYNCVKRNKFSMRLSIDLRGIDRPATAPGTTLSPPFHQVSNVSCFFYFRHTGISREKAGLPVKDHKYLLKISLIILQVAWR